MWHVYIGLVMVGCLGFPKNLQNGTVEQGIHWDSPALGMALAWRQ